MNPCAESAVSRPAEAAHPARAWLLVAALAAAILLLLAQVGWPPRGLTALPLHDFVEYWAAGRLNAAGANPYDPERVHELEREAGREAEGILMWNPPWTLALVMPLGLLDCRTAHLLWLLLHFAVLVWCADALWGFYGGPAQRRWLAWLVALTFLPTLFALTAGQISPLLLLGATGFLLFLRQKLDLAAGAATVLLAVKPHLAYLFWVALLLWSVRQRRRGVLAGLFAAGLAATGVALLCNPDVLGQYWHTLTHRPPAQYRSPTLGTVVRLLLGDGRFGLQFLALVPGLAWLAWDWRRHRGDWVWGDQLPLLLFVSVLTAAYGAWPFDLVLLLVPVVQVAAGVARQGRAGPALAAGAACLAVNGLALAQLACEAEYFCFIWMTPALLACYLVLLPRAGAWGLGGAGPSQARSASDGALPAPAD